MLSPRIWDTHYRLESPRPVSLPLYPNQSRTLQLLAQLYLSARPNPQPVPHCEPHRGWGSYRVPRSQVPPTEGKVGSNIRGLGGPRPTDID